MRKWSEQAPELLVYKKNYLKVYSGTPHQGGSWERLVRSYKRVSYSILGHRRFTNEILLTVFCLVEQTLNARPFTPVSSDPNDTDALTPNYFLLGRPNTGCPPTTSAIDFNHRKRYARAQSFADAIWAWWLKEYIPLLNRRNKWATDSSRALNPGDLVWVAEASKPRGHYPTAQIDSLNYGSDGIARSANLTPKSRTYTRPLTKLVPLFEPTLSGGRMLTIVCQQKMKIVFHQIKIPMP